jgi:alpha-beta hydrolase superfamily lysophospholipase
VPSDPPPRGGRLVVAWAHPMIGDNIAPSKAADPLTDTAPWLDEMIKRGWIVVGTDYVGVGTNRQEWLNGQAEVRDLVDSVRAARQLPGAHAGDRWIAWGDSYGGHAALWSGTLAPVIAPELHLLGVAAAAPVAELAALDRSQHLAPAPTDGPETPLPPAPSLPVIVFQGTQDHVVPPSTTRLLEKSWCATGADLVVRWIAGATHDSVAARSTPQLITWMADLAHMTSTLGPRGKTDLSQRSGC